MADRTLRGSRLGAVSYETEYGAEPAPRNMPHTAAPAGTSSTCRSRRGRGSDHVGVPAGRHRGLLVDGPAPEAKKVKPPRTHWDMLMERRTIADLEEVLAERLDVLRARRGQQERLSARSSRHDQTVPSAQLPGAGRPGGDFSRSAPAERPRACRPRCAAPHSVTRTQRLAHDRAAHLATRRARARRR